MTQQQIDDFQDLETEREVLQKFEQQHSLEQENQRRNQVRSQLEKLELDLKITRPKKPSPPPPEPEEEYIPEFLQPLADEPAL